MRKAKITRPYRKAAKKTPAKETPAVKEIVLPAVSGVGIEWELLGPLIALGVLGLGLLLAAVIFG